MKLSIIVQDTAIAFKVSPHNTDANQLVVKSRHPEVAQLVAGLAGVDGSLIITTKGSANFVSYVPKHVFEAGFGKALLGIMSGALQLAPIEEEAPTGGPDEDEEDDEDGDGDDDEDEDGDE